MKVIRNRRIPKWVEAGHGTYFAAKPAVLFRNYGSKLIIGSYTSIAGGFTAILGGHHPFHHVSLYPFGRGNPGYSRGDIVIGSDCWIGQNVTILDGVTIEDGAVVGAGSIVTKDVAPYSIVAGNPARMVKKRFGEDAIVELLKIRWWEWPEEKVLKAKDELFSSDPWVFIRKYRVD